jgi:sRNA-binding carbon storage regulator CsrA
MLVLNRRPGESIIIEHGIDLSLLSTEGHKVWLGVTVPGITSSVRLSPAAASASDVRLEIAAPLTVRVEEERAYVEVAPLGHPSHDCRTTFALHRKVGQSIDFGAELSVRVSSLARGNPSLALEGPTIGTGLVVTVIRQVGSYVRIGIDAPGRRVYRKEIWDQVVEENRAAAAGDLAALRLATSSA